MAKHLAILGAGPIGIEAALYGRALGHAVTLYERGPAAAANVADWGHVQLFTPWRMNTTPLGIEALRRQERWPEFPADVCPSGEEFREHYLLPLTECEPLIDCLRTDTNVLRVGREQHLKSEAIGRPERGHGPFRLLVETADGEQRIDHAEVVLDCTGTYGNHRWAGRGGIPAPGEMRLEDQIDYTLPDPLGHDRGRFIDRHALLLGCGYSAATFLKDIEQLNRAHANTKVTWAIRKPGQALQAIDSDPLPARRNLVEASLRLAEDPPGWLTFLGSAAVELIHQRQGRFVVDLITANQPDGGPARRTLQCDSVVALVGYGPDTGIYDQLQIHSCYATAGPMNLAAALLGEAGADCLTAGANVTAETLKNPEPDFYILGAKSYGTNSNFLMQAGHHQIRDVFRLIAPGAVELYAAGGRVG
jgi:hypothetical protein